MKVRSAYDSVTIIREIHQGPNVKYYFQNCCENHKIILIQKQYQNLIKLRILQINLQDVINFR